MKDRTLLVILLGLAVVNTVILVKFASAAMEAQANFDKLKKNPLSFLGGGA